VPSSHGTLTCKLQIISDHQKCLELATAVPRKSQFLRSQLAKRYFSKAYHQAMPFDLISVLPQLLPSAVAWVEAQSHRATEMGNPLDAMGFALAKRVGVQHPELVRTQLVDVLPLPDEPALRQAALATGLLGPGTVGLTMGYSIFILRGHLSPRLLSHECRHVYQYEAAGSIAAFLPVYLQQIAMVGYQNAPFEQDARAHEFDAVTGQSAYSRSMIQTDYEFLPGVPSSLVLKRLNAAAGDEVNSGKLSSPESSAALAVNTFGWFMDRPELLAMACDDASKPLSCGSVWVL
jgi:hypothetical protein